jgi:hypothetical protein
MVDLAREEMTMVCVTHEMGHDDVVGRCRCGERSPRAGRNRPQDSRRRLPLSRASAAHGRRPAARLGVEIAKRLEAQF